MSSGSQDKRTEGLEELAEFTRELRQFSGLSASLFRVAATRIGLAVTDIQVLDLLDLIGPATAGQLADLTGLTTGAITRILDRLEKAELICRERDPNDGRKVIVRLESGKDNSDRVRSILDSGAKVWDEVASRYDKEQIAFLLEFLKRGNAQSRLELVRLQQEAPSVEGRIFSAPLDDLVSGRLVVFCGVSRLNVRTDNRMAGLFEARFEGPVPTVKTKEGTINIHYPQRLLRLKEKQGAAEVALNATIPWQIIIRGGAAEVGAELGGLDLAKLEITGGFSKVHLALPAPTGAVPIRISGGASEIIVRRPAGIAARAHLKGWVSTLVFDDQAFSGVGANARLQSDGFDEAAPRYDIAVTSYASMVNIIAS